MRPLSSQEPAPSSDSLQTVASGEVPPARFGDYLLLEMLGRGSMGEVFKAEQPRPRRLVALKRVVAGADADEIELQRFAIEVEAIAGFSHPNILPLFEFGQHDGQFFYTMPLVEGGSLQDLLSDGPIPPRRAARLIMDVADAIVYAHQRGIVHRDLKPANILLDTSGKPFVVDFGLAKRLGQDSSASEYNQPLGTPSYMPPEQIDDPRGVDARSDVYGLGAVLYALLTGRPPFREALRIDTLLKVRSAHAVPPRECNRAVPPDLNAICVKCLQKCPDDRYPTALALAEDLEAFFNGRDVAARPAGVVRKIVRTAKRNSLETVLIAGVFALLTALLGVMSFAYRHAERSNRQLGHFHAALTQEHEKLKKAKDKVVATCQGLEQEKLRANNSYYALQIQIAHDAMCAQCYDRADHMLASLGSGGWEWRYLRELCQHRKPLRIPAHRHLVTAMAVSPDGDRVASAALHERSILVHSLRSGICEKRLTTDPDRPAELPTEMVRALSFSPDGRRLVSADDEGRVLLWDLDSGKATQIPINTAGRESIAAFDPNPRNNRFAWATADGRLGLYDVGRKSCPWQKTDLKQRILRIAFDRQGRHIAAAGAVTEKMLASGDNFGVVTLHSASTGNEIQRYVEHRGPVYDVAFGDDGETLISCDGDGMIHWWNTSGRPSERLGLHPGAAYAVGLRQRFALSAGSDGSVRIWSLDDGGVLSEFNGHRGAVYQAAFVQTKEDACVAAATENGDIHVWDRRQRETCLRRLERYPPGIVRALEFSHDGRRLAVGTDTGVSVFDVDRDKEARMSIGGPVEKLAFCGADELVTVDRAGTARKMRIAAETVEITQSLTDVAAVRSVAEGGWWGVQAVSAVHSPHADRAKGIIALPLDLAARVVISASGEYLVVEKNGQLDCWQLANQKRIGALPAPQGTIALAVDSHRRIWLATNSGLVMAFDLATRKELCRFPSGGVNGDEASEGNSDDCHLVLNREGSRLIIAHDRGRAEIWAVPHSPLLAVEPVRHSPLPAVEPVRLLVLDDEGGFDDVRAAAFAPKDALLATADSRGVVRLWGNHRKGDIRKANREQSDLKERENRGSRLPREGGHGERRTEVPSPPAIIGSSTPVPENWRPVRFVALSAIP